MMRRFPLAVLAALSFTSATPALAVQKFIPLGHSSLEQSGDLPRFGTPEADFNLQTDIYETENFLRAREAKEFDNRFRRFLSAPHSPGNSPIVDY